MPSPLSIYAGREAAARLARDGWDPRLFSLLLGASGGPKWFILSGLDRYLFGDFLQRSDHPFAALGSSVGSWRHACLAQPDPVAAIDRFAEAYLTQHYSARPDVEEVSAASMNILDRLLGAGGSNDIVTQQRITSYIVTARGRGATASTSRALLAAGMGLAAGSNALGRGLLQHAFQRVLFRSAGGRPSGLALPDFRTREVELTAANVRPALHASGSIPFVLSGERDIPGAPPGQYWDGGIIDYHFDLGRYSGDGLILFPHFRGSLTPGWFDKFLPWRRHDPRSFSSLVLLCPSPAFVASLPLGKIPDRSDFTRLPADRRIANWQSCIARSAELADALKAVVTGDDPLQGVSLLN